MIENFGRAGTPRNPLQPARTTPPSFAQGPFAAVLRPTLHARQVGAYPLCLFLDFIINRPDHDGIGANRLIVEGHQSIEVSLQVFSSSMLIVPQAVRFEAAATSDVYALAAYDEVGAMWAWGSHLPYAHSKVRPAALEFRSHQIQVRRLIAAVAGAA